MISKRESERKTHPVVSVLSSLHRFS